MEAEEQLRQIVAQLAGLKPEAIDMDFSLKSRGLQSSVRRAALAAAIRRYLGLNIAEVYGVLTFRELVTAVSQRGNSERIQPVAAVSGLRGVDDLACGIDIERVDAMPVTDDYWEHEFYKENFSKDEIAYCLLQENPRMHFAARWCAKEALVKCEPAYKGQPFSTLEVVRDKSGEVSLAHHANGSSTRPPMAVSISHTDTMAAAVVVRRQQLSLGAQFKEYWMRGWMKFAGPGVFRRLATRLATGFAPPFFKRNRMAYMNRKGYVSPWAGIDHSQLRTGPHVFIGDGVKIMEGTESGYIDLGERVELHRELTLHTGQGGNIVIGPRSSVHPGCYLIAYKSSIRIGADVQIASNCAFYPYNHGFAPGTLIADQPLTSRGDIVLEDDVNIGFGVVVLDGVTIGKGAAVGAGSVVVQNIPPGAIAMGVPARVLRMRSDFEPGRNGKDEAGRIAIESRTPQPVRIP
jgi:phosphopantetheine--protein transferase-like protein